MVKKKDLLTANKSSQDMTPDLSDLDNLHEAALLHTMGMRYCGEDKAASGVTSLYCTFIGAICVATNPFAPQKAWTNSFNFKDYVTSQPDVISNKKLQPHPWSVGDLAYQEMMKEGKNQAILICGESGAGKTRRGRYSYHAALYVLCREPLMKYTGRRDNDFNVHA